MSLDAMKYAKDVVVGVTSAEKLILLLLADFHHPSRNIAWPSMPTLARLSIMSERNVRRVLDALETKKFIVREYPNGRRDTIFYSFPALSKADNMSPLDENLRRTSAPSKADTKADKSSSAIRKNGLTVEATVNPARPTAAPASPDPLWQWLIDTFNDAYEAVNKVPCPWNPRAFTVLKQLRGRTTRWTKDNFEKAIAHYFNSDDVNPADAPEFVFKILTRYAVGELNIKHLPKDRANGKTRTQEISKRINDQVERAVSRSFRTRGQHDAEGGDSDESTP